MNAANKAVHLSNMVLSYGELFVKFSLGLDSKGMLRTGRLQAYLIKDDGDLSADYQPGWAVRSKELGDARGPMPISIAYLIFAQRALRETALALGASSLDVDTLLVTLPVSGTQEVAHEIYMKLLGDHYVPNADGTGLIRVDIHNVGVTSHCQAIARSARFNPDLNGRNAVLWIDAGATTTVGFVLKDGMLDTAKGRSFRMRSALGQVLHLGARAAGEKRPFHVQAMDLHKAVWQSATNPSAGWSESSPFMRMVREGVGVDLMAVKERYGSLDQFDEIRLIGGAAPLLKQAWDAHPLTRGQPCVVDEEGMFAGFNELHVLASPANLHLLQP